MMTPNRSGERRHRSRPRPVALASIRPLLALGTAVPLILGDKLTAQHVLAPLRLLSLFP